MILTAQIEQIVGKSFDCFVTLHAGLHGKFHGSSAMRTGRYKQGLRVSQGMRVLKTKRAQPETGGLFMYFLVPKAGKPTT